MLTVLLSLANYYATYTASAICIEGLSYPTPKSCREGTKDVFILFIFSVFIRCTYQFLQKFQKVAPHREKEGFEDTTGYDELKTHKDERTSSNTANTRIPRRKTLLTTSRLSTVYEDVKGEARATFHSSGNNNKRHTLNMKYNNIPRNKRIIPAKKRGGFKH